MTKLTIVAFIAVLISACSNSSEGSDSGAAAKVENPGPSPTASSPSLAKLKASGIEGRKYRLKADLDFANADIQHETLFPDSNLKTEVTEYSYTFESQRRLSVSEIERSKTYCSISVETYGGKKGDEIRFAASDRLLSGQIATADVNGDVSFQLQLQGAMFQSFFLSCRNVLDVDQVLRHIGNLIEIVP